MGVEKFAFRCLLKCGRCGADITAQEKFKKLKNGEFNRHVYYNCTKRFDPNCKEKYINENDLRILLQEFIETNHKKIRVNDKLQARIEKHYGVTKLLFDYCKVKVELESPFVEYSRYVLNNGSEGERASLTKGMLTRLAIKDSILELIEP